MSKLKDKLNEIEEEIKQIKIDESVNTAYQFYQELIPQLNTITEQLKENKNEKLIDIVTTVEDLVEEYTREFPEREIPEIKPEEGKTQFYTINPQIEQYYNQKEISLHPLGRLFINTLLCLQNNKQHSRTRDLYFVLNKIDPSRYGGDKKTSRGKVASQLDKMKKNKIVKTDTKHNWIVNDYNKISNLVDPSLTELIKEIPIPILSLGEQSLSIIPQNIIDNIKDGTYNVENHLSLVYYDKTDSKFIKVLFEEFGRKDYKKIAIAASNIFKGLTNKAKSTEKPVEIKNGRNRYVDSHGCIHQNLTDAIKAQKGYN